MSWWLGVPAENFTASAIKEFKDNPRKVGPVYYWPTSDKVGGYPEVRKPKARAYSDGDGEAA